MAVRLSGLVSNMDTDSMVKELVKAKQTEVDNVGKKKTKLEWKKEAWEDLNKKIYALYTDQLTALKQQKSYTGKIVSVTDDTKATISGDINAITGTQSLDIKQLASSAFVTSAKVGTVSSQSVNMDTKLSDLGVSKDVVLEVTQGGSTRQITVSASSTLNELQTQLNDTLDPTTRGIKLNLADGKLSMDATLATDQNFTIADKNATAGSSQFFQALGFGDTKTSLTMSNAAPTVSADYKAYKYSQTAMTGATRLEAMAPSCAGKSITVNFQNAAKTDVNIEITSGMTINDLVRQFQTAGINAQFDEKQQRFLLSSKQSGAEQNFSIDFGEDSKDIQRALGLGDGAQTVKGANSKIIYNGAEIEDTSNTIKIGGLTMNLKGLTTAEPLGITVSNDTEGAYKVIKDFVTSYNALIEEMNKLYSADAAKGYEPLTDEERSAMSDKQAELWDDKIKKALLRRDDTVSTVLSSMRTQLNSSVEVTMKDGTKKKLGLSSLGIETGAYTEKGKLHINGDPDDSAVRGLDNDLKSMLTEDPEAVMQALTGIGNNLYKDLGDRMKAIKNTRSIYKFYNDKTMDSQITDYKDKISTMQQKLADLEDRYYKQFTAMEKALSKLNSQSSSLAGMLGTGK